MTLTKVSPGQPLRVTADAFNAFIDAANAHRAGQLGVGAEGTATGRTAGIVTVRNDSGADQDRFAVLGIGTPLILPSDNAAAFQERIALSLVAPDEELQADRFCILQEPIAAGALGRGLILGVTPVRLDVTAEDDRTATIVTNETGTLRTGSSGAARILWKEAGTGERWGIVQIPSGGSDGGSPNLVLEVSQTAHGWLVSDVLRWNGGAWVFADAGVVGDTDTLAVVGQIPDDDHALLVLWGLFCLDGLAPHTDYWLDPVVPGALTVTKPASNPRLVLHHAEGGLCVLRAGAAGGGGSASRFADLTDVDVVTTPPTQDDAALWDATAERWVPRAVLRTEPVQPHQVLAGPATGPDALPTFRVLALEDLPELAPTSVLANAGGSAAAPQPLAASADHHVLFRQAGALVWGLLQGESIAAGAVTTPAIADGAVTDAKITTLAWGKLTNVPASFPPAPHDHTLAGAVTGTLAATQIAPGAVGTTELANAAVTSIKIGGGQIVAIHLAPNAVTTPALANAAVTTVKIADATGTADGVTGPKLRWSPGTSILGRNVAATGPVVNIVASSDDSVLARVGGILGFQTTLPRLRVGGTATGFWQLVNSGGVVSHEYEALNTVQAWKQFNNGRTRWYWSPTDYWEVSANGTTIEIKAWSGGTAGHTIALQGSVNLGGAPRRLSLREVDFCDNGVARKIAILASDPY